MSGDKMDDELRDKRVAAYWRLQKLRKLGYRIDDLSEMSGCSRTTVWRMSTSPSWPATAENVEKVLNMREVRQLPLPGFE